MKIVDKACIPIRNVAKFCAILESKTAGKYSEPNFRLIPKPLMGVYFDSRLKYKNPKLIHCAKTINKREYLRLIVQSQFLLESLIVKILKAQTMTVRIKTHCITAKYKAGHFGLSKITIQSQVTNLNISANTPVPMFLNAL